MKLFTSCVTTRGIDSLFRHFCMKNVDRGTKTRIIMRLNLIALFLTMSILQVCASSLHAQNITLSLRKASLKTVFDEIEKQTGYGFLYNKSYLESTKEVSLNIQNQSLKETLEICFKGQPITYDIVGKTIVIKPKPKNILESIIDHLKPIPVKGKVVDEKDQPLIGVTIRVKGTNTATTTNEVGTFAIEVPDQNAILIISYIGLQTQEYPVNGNSNLIIKLKESTSDLQLVNVVSNGYQIIPKERATGSFSIVNQQLYNEQVGTDVLSRLEGVANGVSVFRNNTTATSKLMVRGLSSISGPDNPLIVVDNFPYEGDLNNLNPNDVESVTVLKDAAASSIWGTKAGNGVIVITTKKGKLNQPLSIEINSNVMIGGKPNLDYLTPMSSADYIDYERFLFGKGYYNSQITSNSRPVMSPVVELLAKARSGTITQSIADEQINAMRGLDVRDNYSKFIYSNQFNQQHYINLKGGSDTMTYLFSTGYDKNINNLSAKFDRLNLRSEASFKPIEKLFLSTGLRYTKSSSQTGKIGYSGSARPYEMLADAQGNALPIGQTYSQSFKETAALTGKLLDWNYYALTDYKHNETTNDTQDLLATFSAQYKIVEPLSIDFRYQYEKQQDNDNTLYDDQSYFSRNLINSFTQVNGNTVTNIIPKGGILDQQITNLISNNIRAQANFDKRWGDHNLTLLAGEELREIKRNSSKYRSYGYNEQVLTSSFVDYQTLYPNYVTRINARIPSNNGFSKTLNRFVSFYANGAYTYRGKYTLSGSMRRDASNLFGVETNDKWTPLWSTGFSWLISNEKFYQFTLVPYLKIRATYGFSGNIDPSKSAVTTISYASTPSQYTGSPYSAIQNFYNPDLRWEKISTANIGLDFRTQSNCLSGSIDFYRKKATDLYASVPIDYTVGLGYSDITKNVAAMHGNGVDVELNSININGDFKWQSALNFNYYKDKVTEFYPTSNNGSSYVRDLKNPLQNFPVWGVYAYRWAGLDANGNPQGYLNGQVSNNYTSITGAGTQVSDLKYIGPRIPVFYGSLGNTFSYRSLSLSVRLSYSFGNYFRRQSLNYSSAANGTSGHSDYAERWQNPGDEVLTNVPSVVYPLISARDNFYAGSEVLIEKADVVRLQYINLSYNLSRKNHHWVPFNDMNVFLNANNLGILWCANKYGIDPDYTSTSLIMPIPKNIALGLRASF